MNAAPALYTRTSFCHLASGVSMEHVADEARSAAVAFLNGISAGGRKRELAQWLSGPYARATRHAPSPGGGRRRAEDGRGSPPRDTSKSAPLLDEATISRLLRDARAAVLTALEGGGTGADCLAHASFVGNALARNLAIPCIDTNGRHGWVPVDAPSARLHQRLLALFAVDQLQNPELYRAALLVCPTCGRIVFDAEAKARGACCDQVSIAPGVAPTTTLHATTSTAHVTPARTTTRALLPAYAHAPATAPAHVVPIAKRTLSGVRGR